MVIDGSVGLDVCGCVDVCILTWVLGCILIDLWFVL